MADTPHLGCGAERHGGSSPSTGTQCGSISMVESLPSKQYVASSNLVFRSHKKMHPWANWLSHNPFKVDIARSSRVGCTKIKVVLSVRLHIYMKRRCVCQSVKIVGI